MDYEKPRDDEGLDNTIAGYAVLGTGAVIGSAAYQSEAVREGLEEVVTGSLDYIPETMVEIIKALPGAIDKPTICAIIGAGIGKILLDSYYGLRKLAGKTKNKTVEFFAKTTLYYVGLTTGVTYANNKNIFEDMIENAPGWYKEFIQAGTSMHTLSMLIGIGGVGLLYNTHKRIKRARQERRNEQ